MTRADHERVDAAFAGFDLGTRASYAAFLRGHARVLPALERDLTPATRIAGWTGRSAALAADLEDLGADLPPPEAVEVPAGDGALWGALYVIEGSRLGGAVLARDVGAGLPSAYLRSTHAPGSWRRFLATMEDALEDSQNLAVAVASAKNVFAAYHRAAERERDFG